MYVCMYIYVCVCMCVCVCVCVKALSSPLDITVSSLISGLFVDCEKTGLDQLLYVGVFLSGTYDGPCRNIKTGLAESLVVQPIIVITELNVV